MKSLMQNRFDAAFKFLMSVIAKQTSLAILGCIKVVQTKSSITYEATDLTTFLQIRLPVWTDIEGTFALDAKTFMKLDDKVATKIEPGRVQFSKVIVSSLESAEFPSLDLSTFGKPVFHLQSFDKDLLSDPGLRASNHVSKQNEGREALEGVCFRGDKFYGTDGHTLVSNSLPIKTPKKEEYIIPVSFFKYLQSDFIIDPYVDVSIYKMEDNLKYAEIAGRSFRLITKLIQGPYPDVDKVIPKESSFEFTFNKNEMLPVVDTAIRYVNEATWLIDINLSSDCKKLEISAAKRECGIQYKDEVPVKTSTDKWHGISLNAKYFAMILREFSGNTVTLKAGQSPISAVTIHPEDKNLLFLQMPLRKVEEEPQPQQEVKSEAENNNEIKSQEQKRGHQEGQKEVETKAA